MPKPSSLLLLVVATAARAATVDLSGEYSGRTEDGAVVLTLRQGPGGEVTGTLVEGGAAAPVSGRVDGRKLTAKALSDGTAIAFAGVLEGNSLKLTVMGRSMTLTRAAAPDGGRAAPSSPGPAPAVSSLRVVVNGIPLEPAEIESVQRRHGIRFTSGDFWYDRRSGAWGVVGGPTVGLVAPGLPLRGELRRDASRGDTGVIVNGRELRVEEVLALQQIVPVYRGSYWIDAQGNFGLEGGPMVGNLAAAAQARQAPREGILSTYDRTGVAVFGY